MHSNSFGVRVQGVATVVGNTIYNHVGPNASGIEASGASTVSRNVVYGNIVGISSNGEATIAENRVYNNSTMGIVTAGGAPILRNVVYSNSVGIGVSNYTGTISNNVVYANSDASIFLSQGGNATVVNNTIVQTAGDGVRISNLSSGIRLRNNSIWAQGGFAINVASDSQAGFQSDYNNLFASGSGSIARWQNVTRPTMASWRATAFTDSNSLNNDPSFVSLLGADGVLGFSSTTNDGRDDDMHLRSQFGTFQGISFAPVASATGTGTPAFLTSSGNPVAFAITSKLVDRGAPTDSFAAEPTPNGGAINIGAYGGTNQASLSPAEYVTVTNPDGAEIWPLGQSVSIRWRNQQPSESVTFKIDLIKGSTSVLTIADSAPNTGLFDWTVPANTVIGDDYRIQVTRNDNAAIQDISDNFFSIRTPVSVYYVNDGTVVAGDYSTATGNLSNSGQSPSSPLDSIGSVLTRYVLKAGDTILVDAGTYTLSTALVLNAAASGITIRGFADPSNPARATILDRANTNFNAIELVNADDVTLDRLTIRNANNGIFASDTSDSDRLTISNSTFEGNLSRAIALGTSSDFASLQGNRLSRGALLQGPDATVNGNAFVNMSSGTALDVRGLRSLVSNNTFSNIQGGSVNVATSGATNATRVIVRQNTFTDVATGFAASDNTLVQGNTFVRANIAGSSIGEVRDNIIREGVDGIFALGTTVVSNNRFFMNSGIGLTIGANSTTFNNYFYNNNVGIAAGSSFTGEIANNFLANNTSSGITVVSGGGPTITNNTVIQSTGDAIRLSNASTQNVNVKNNILQVNSGYAINVDGDAGRGFRSDYNVIHTLGTGKIGRWQGIDFTNSADWFYEVGLDKNTTFGDPQFVDLDGPDNVLGFSRGSGISASYFANNTLSGSPFLTRTETVIGFAVGGGTPVVGLPVDNFSVRYEGFLFIPTAGNYTFFEAADNGVRLFLDGSSTPLIDNWSSTGTEQSYSTSFSSAGWVAFRLEYRELTGFASLAFNWSGPGFSKRAIIPDYLNSTLPPNVGDYGQDDSFAVSSSSPAIDGGSPEDFYFRESLPNGGRLNIGAAGNSNFAESSSLQSVQVLSPNGLEKFEQGQAVPITIRSNGLLQNQPTMLLNVGVNTIGPWGNGSKFQTAGIVSGFFGNEFTNAVIDRSGVTDPIPEELYRNYLASDTGTNATLRLRLPVADGTYSMRLHFIEGIATAIGTRRFDIKINGTTVRAGYDIFANAGTRFKAVAETLTGLVASGGSGLTLELTTLTPSFQALLSALEIFAAAPLGTSTSSVSLEFSGNGGTQWSPIPGANAVPLDRWGNGSFTWTLPANLSEGDSYRIRARSNAVLGGIVDISDAPFIVTNSGNDYYVNDNVVAGDFFTTAPGSNNASGKSPDQPLASLTALLSSYSFQPGDVIHIDTGTHRLIRTLTLNNRFNGVRFEGPTTGTAVLDRNNTNFNMFELQNADDLSFDRLTFRNATYSVFANDASDSDRLSIQRSSFSNNQSGSIFLGLGSDFTTLQNNEFNVSTRSTVILSGTDSIVTENQFSNSSITSVALEIRGARSRVSSNTFSNVRSAISIQPSGFISVADRVIVTNNTITDANGTAITVGGSNTLVENNVVTRAVTGVSGSGEIRNNVIRGGTTGMRVVNSVVEDNRIFNHSGSGLIAGPGTITRNNRIYNNNVGVETELGFNGTVSNNYLVNNTSAGFSIFGAGYNGGVPTYSQNTIIQSIGDAFRVTDFRSSNVLIENNIIQVGQDYAYNVNPDATRGFRADYNLIHRIGTGKIARWENTDFNDAADWYYEVGMDQNSVFANPLFVDLDGLDNQLGYSTTLTTDFGADDNFGIQANSPAMDSGNPISAYSLEPVPNGGRINLGGTANSILAEVSVPQTIQVLSPDGLEKFEQGQTVPISINTNGLRNIQPALLVNGGGTAVGRWLPGNRYTTTGLVGAGNTELATATIDRSGVADPPPEEVYRTFTTADSNPGVRVAMKLPIANGTYSVRLHFIEGQVTAVGTRRFDIRINGTTVRANYDIFQAAGSVRFKATAESFNNIITSNGEGLTIELVNVTGSPARIAAIEVFQAAPIGTASPTVALEFSDDAGENWTPISGANAVPVDRWGNASFNWTIPSGAVESSNYRIRARAIGSAGIVEDTSDASFTVANNGPAYYLSPTGDNRNSGKQVDQPMRSLSGLIESYDLDAGDVVELLGGSYRTYRNINLGPNDSGVTLLAGPNNPATINRGNTNASMRVMEFTGADGATIDGLRLTGGENGIVAVSDLSSINNTITNSHLFGNLSNGLMVGTSNPGWQITNSKFYGLPGGSANDNQAYGIFFVVAGPNTSTGYQILSNDIYDNSAVGIWQPTAGTLIESNNIYGNQQGITSASEGLTVPLVIRGNKVRENAQWGVSVTSTNMQVTDNDIFGHTGAGDYGVIANGGALVTNNRIYDNTIGADVFGSSGGTSFTTFSGNRVFGNSSIGINANGFAQINGNYVYSNSIGIQASSQFLGDIQNNVIYANTNRGLSIQNPLIGTASARYANNTIYQAVGDGVRLEGSARNNILTNNIIWVLSGFAINVSADSQTGFQSNYQLVDRKQRRQC